MEERVVEEEALGHGPSYSRHPAEYREYYPQQEEMYGAQHQQYSKSTYVASTRQDRQQVKTHTVHRR